MKKLILMLTLSFTGLMQAQKLGLVLSGGGAPGIAHIGIIKALEENDIPIDYITGTSIGAIIGGMYAMGMTPQEMTQVIKSKDFKNWTNGEMDWENQYYYSYENDNPGVFDVRFHVDKNFSIEFKSILLPTNLVSPHQINYAFVPLTAQANAVAKGDFDKLFVPFRCVASDIYNKQSVIFRKGDLGDAIRASTTFPFMFKPIEIENRLLFDGGIYNNFPVDIMHNDFNPDYIIGSVVAYNPAKPDRTDVVNQLQNMIIHPTDYSLATSEGLLFNFNLKDINTFDFSKVDELVKIGYDSTVAHLNEIRAHIPRHLTHKELTKQRQTFRSHFPDLAFKNIIVDGVDSLQIEYIKGFFDNNKKTVNLYDFKNAYFKLVSNDLVSEVIPHAIYNSDSGVFDLHLKVESENQLKILIGGNASTFISNQAYIGLNYHSLTNLSKTAYIDAQIGQIYNGMRIGTRIELSSKQKHYLKVNLIIHKIDYTTLNIAPYFSQNEVYGKIHFGFPVKMHGRFEIGAGYGALSNNYYQNAALQNTTHYNDNSRFYLGSIFGNIESNTLNNIMHPTKGFNYSSKLQIIGGEETYKSDNYPVQKMNGKMDLWFQYRAKMEHYFPINSHFTLGTMAEMNISTRKLLENYTVTLIQAPAFQPTPYSRTVFNGSYCANQFAAIGLKPIYNISNQLHVRTETYWFVPYKSIMRGENNLPFYSNPFSTSQFMSETSLVFNFKMASASMFVNYFSSAASKWNVGVNIGILLFNSKFIE